MDETADTAGKKSRPRGIRIVLGLCAVTIVGVAAAIYVVFSSGESGGKEVCPPQATATGHDEPKFSGTGQQNWLQVTDQGFVPYRTSDSETGDEKASFGVLFKNTTEYVLLGGKVTFSLVDENGDDPTTGFNNSQQEDNAYSLESAEVPVLFPGQEAGLGGALVTWTSMAETSDGETFEPDPVDYQNLELRIDAIEGEWWHPHNDKYHFVELDSVKADPVDPEPKEPFRYEDGPGISPLFEYTVDSHYCDSIAAYSPSAVAYDSDGNIIGGATSTPNGEPDYDRYTPGNNNAELGFADPIPNTEVTAQVFSYADPAELDD